MDLFLFYQCSMDTVGDSHGLSLQSEIELFDSLCRICGERSEI